MEPKAHFNEPEIQRIYQAGFGNTTRERYLSKHIHDLKDHLKSRLYEFCHGFGIDMLIPENALAIPPNIPLGLTITEFPAETGMPAIAHHHNFSWERKRFLITAIQDLLNYAFPPILVYLYDTL